MYNQNIFPSLLTISMHDSNILTNTSDNLSNVIDSPFTLNLVLLYIKVSNHTTTYGWEYK